MEQQFSSINHRYVPHRPTISDDHRNSYLRHHNHLPPQLPLPPSYPILPPPPPPPFNPQHQQQSQFTFLNHHHQNLAHTVVDHHHRLHSPPLPRVSTRILFQDDHHHPHPNRTRDLNLPYPDRPKVPPLHYRPTDLIYNHDLDPDRNYRYRDEPVHGYRGKLQSQIVSRDQNDRHKRGRDHEGDLTVDKDHRSLRFLPNSGRSRDSYSGPKSSVSRDLVPDLDRAVGNQESYVPKPNEERLPSKEDENWTWQLHIDSPVAKQSHNFETSKEIPSVSTRRLSNVQTSGKFNYRNSPKKKIQKKSAFLRIGKPNSKNKSSDHISNSHFDDSDTSYFRGKDENPIEENTVGSPVELNVSFKSNSLVAKPIMSPSSPSVVANRNLSPLSPRNRLLRKADASNSPKTKFTRRLIKLDRSTYGSDSPSSSDKGPKQSPEQVQVGVSANVSLRDIGSSLPSSIGTDDSAGSGGVKGSPVPAVTEEVGNNGGSDIMPSSTVGKKKKVAPTTLKEEGELVDEDTNSPSKADEAVVDPQVQVESVEIIMVHADDSPPSLNEPMADKPDESPQDSEDEYVDIESVSPRVPSTVSLIDGLTCISNFNEVLTDLQNESTVIDLEKVDDVGQQLCETEIINISSDEMVSAGPTSSGDVSSPEETKPHKTPDSHAIVVYAPNDLKSKSELVEREENGIEPSGFDSIDGGHKQCSMDVSDALLEKGIPHLSDTEGPKIDEGATSNSKIDPAHSQEIDMVCNDCLVDYSNDDNGLVDDSNDDNGLVERSLKTNDSFGKGTPKAKEKRKVIDIVLRSSSPSACETPLYGVSSVVDGEITTLSHSLKDLTSTEEEVSGSGLVNPCIGLQTCNDDNALPICDVQNDRSTQVELSVGDGVSVDLNVNSHSGKKKRKLTVNHKPVSKEMGTPDEPKAHMKSVQAMLNDVSVNSIPSKGIQGELSSLRGNHANSAVSRVFTSRPSLVLSRKVNPTNNISRPRTWHRADDPSVSLPPKKTYSSVAPLPKLSPRKTGRIQEASYIRKGHSLVRKPTLPATLSHDSSRTSVSSVYQLNPSNVGETKKNSISESKDGIDAVMIMGAQNSPFERPKTPLSLCSTKSMVNMVDMTVLPRANTPPNGASEIKSNFSGTREHVDQAKSSEEVPGTDSISTGTQSVTNEAGKIRYVKRKANQLVAASNNGDQCVEDVDKTHGKLCEGYYKRRKNQIVRTSTERQIMHGVDDTSNSEGKWAPKFTSSRSSVKKQFSKGSTKMYNKLSKLSPVWRLSNMQSARKTINSSQQQKVWPYLFPWKRGTYGRSFVQSAPPVSVDSSLPTISQKLLLSRKRDTIYTRSTHGFSLRISKLLSVGGSSLKWSKSIERNSKKANEEATKAVAAAEKKKRERNCTARARVYRIGAVRYKMDPTRRTLQRISDEKHSSSASHQSEKDDKKPYIPRRLVIGNNEYVRLGNGNQLIRDPKKRTRTLASEKVRWSLHTARLRLAKKNKYCQFFTRFGKCNKDDGKCPYIHDRSKIAVCTKFLNGSCFDPYCKLTHEVIPERMQDCSYFLQGLCTNEKCPYRHVNVNANAAVCEGFLKGYCADGNECRKKHTYVCPIFEATGKCLEGSKCKLHHPKTRTNKSTKRKPSIERKNARGRYFAENIRTTGFENRCNIYSKKKEDIFFQEGKFADFVMLDVSDDEKEEDIGMRIEERSTGKSTSLDVELGRIDGLIKPIGIMLKNLAMETLPPIESASVY